MKIININSSNDGKTFKILQLTDDNYVTETGVFDDGPDVHLCISSQLGCKIECQMCYNGVNKTFFRSLTSDEIIKQVLNIMIELNLEEKYDNIWFSFMGVGEPLLNYDNVIAAIKYLETRYPDCYFALATTLPNCERIKNLINDLILVKNFKLTISLHAATDEKRKKLIPTHRSMKELRDAMNLYKKNGGHKCEWNYVLLRGFNDSDQDFLDLLNFLEPDDRIKISSYNEIENGLFKKSDFNRYAVLDSILTENGIYHSRFDSAGDSINAGCGQMAAKKLEKIRRN